MPAIDTCQPQVIRALERDGWRIHGTNVFRYHDERHIFIDIEAVHGANGSTRQILLAEVKCFFNESDFAREIYIAIGQYMIYRALLDKAGDSRPLYLAMPISAYQKLFDSAILQAISYAKMRLILVDLVKEEIIEWKE